MVWFILFSGILSFWCGIFLVLRPDLIKKVAAKGDKLFLTVDDAVYDHPKHYGILLVGPGLSIFFLKLDVLLATLATFAILVGIMLFLNPRILQKASKNGNKIVMGFDKFVYKFRVSFGFALLVVGVTIMIFGFQYLVLIGKLVT
jgi:hypothetical protein